MMQGQYAGGGGMGMVNGRLEGPVGGGKGLLGWQQGQGGQSVMPRQERVIVGGKGFRERVVWEEEDEQEVIMGRWN